METAIEVKELRKHYEQARAVDGVSFHVAAGEIFGLLGPNGAGKTTTVECLLGLRAPDAGGIRLLGLAQPEHSEYLRSRMGVQLQTTGLLPQLQVLEQVMLFQNLFPKSLPADEVLEMVGLKEMKKTLTKALSGGQKQRLVIALALVNDPDLVFLDEPTTGLDPQARRAIWDVVWGLQRRGKTVLLTTHYMEEAEQLCDRVGIMDKGKIIELASPQALIRKHFEETAIEFKVPGGLTRQDVTGLPGVTQTRFENGHATLYSTRVPDTMATLYQYINDRNEDLEGITIRGASLEDVFLKLTGRRIRS